MSVGAVRPSARVISAQPSLGARLVELWRHRELLGGMIRTQLKIKYKNSVLGFLWSMVNPALYLAVFYVVFQLILKNNIDRFAVFLLSGLLVWNLFSVGLAGAVGSVTGQAGLVKKVSFPRALLPLAAVGTAVFHFLLQSLVLVLALVLFRQPVGWEYMWLVPLALITLVVLTSALGVLLAAINVAMRDTQHFLELALLAWFWCTPVVYGYMLVGTRSGLAATLYKCNPVLWIVLAFQRALYNISFTSDGAPLLPTNSPWWFGWHLLIVLGLSVVLFLVAMAYFGRVEGNFAEEL